MDNPLTSPQFENDDRVIVPTGRYNGYLKNIKTKEVPEKDEKGMPTGKMIPKLMFIFEIDEPKGAFVTKMVSTSTWAGKGNESGLVKILRELDFTGLSKVKKENEKIYDKDSLWKFTTGLIGKRFRLSVDNNGTYNNYIGATPLEAEQRETDGAKEASKHLDDDNIPF